jgi:hypothetical protein
MTNERVAAIEALLAESEAAHGEFERTELGGTYDQDWPRWYARYAVEHGIGDILGRSITADQLAQTLSTTWAEFERADPRPSEGWTTYIARRLADEP